MVECPKCGSQRVEAMGRAEVTCDVETYDSIITDKPATSWSQWEVIDTADLYAVTCYTCLYNGDPEEFGL